jgi:predicted transcriptional regulator
VAEESMDVLMMVENVISLNPQSSMKEAADAFIRYEFRARPVPMKRTSFWVLSFTVTL